MTSWQKAIKYAAMALAILTVSIISGIFGVFGMATNLFGTSTEKDMKTYEISETVTSLDLDIIAADFSIEAGDELRVASNLKNISVKVKNGKLIVEDETHNWFGNSQKGKLVLYIPENFEFEKALISTGAGNVFMENLTAEQLILKLGAGKVDIENLVTKTKTEIDGGAGEITIQNGTLQNLDFDSGVGEVNFEAAVLGKSEISVGVGETNITLIGTKEDYEINIKKGLGQVTVDGQKFTDNSRYGTGENEIEINVGVGSIYVSFK